jgi:hypothetical protein
MTNGNEVAARFVEAFEALDVDYFLAGSYSSNYYGVPRATNDADFVAVLSGRAIDLAKFLGDEFVLDPQTSFEGITGTLRDIFVIPSVPFKVEVFHLSDDPHDRSRFERRVLVFDEDLGREVYIPTPEDVIVTKLRWEKLGKRGKDAVDVRDVIAVLGDDALDWDYIHRWTDEHGTRALLDEIRASIPPIE